MKEHEHSIYTRCHECNTWGINLPDYKKCGNCGSEDTTTYYPEECLDIPPVIRKKDGIAHYIFNN